MIVSFVVLPLFFLSGALFPLDNLPEWLLISTMLNPATYAVDALRSAILDLGKLSIRNGRRHINGIYSRPWHIWCPFL